jgi:hypothetical protein
MFLCLHKKKHAKYIKDIQKWIKPFRKQKTKGQLKIKFKKAITNPSWAIKRTYEKIFKNI